MGGGAGALITQPFMDTAGGKYSYRLSKKFTRADCKMNSSLDDIGLASRDFGEIWRDNLEWGVYGEIT